MPNIHQELLIASPAQVVFDAITTGKGLAGWWGLEATAEPEVGGIARVRFGQDYVKELEIIELDAPKRLRWKCLKGVDEWVGTTLSFEIEHGDKDEMSRSRYEISDQVGQAKKQEQSLVVFHHDDWRAYTPMFAECSYTWGRFLSSLKRLCEQGEGRPWPHQHAAGE